MRIILDTNENRGQPRPHPDDRSGPGFGSSRPAPRTTRQRLAVAELLSELDDFRSAQEIHAALRERGERIGLATVYRSLALLAEAGDVDALTREDGEAVYLLCSRQHHHHLVCRSCGRAVEIAGPAVERWAAELAERHGYTAISHTLEVFGLCPRCSTD
jgi:Fur family ferric uptake transcriptional regulator